VRKTHDRSPDAASGRPAPAGSPRRWLLAAACAAACLVLSPQAPAQTTVSSGLAPPSAPPANIETAASEAPGGSSEPASAANSVPSPDLSGFLSGGPKAWTSREGLSSALQVMLLLTVLSLAPAVLLMTTCFVRIVVVLALLRQALGTQQLPPGQVITSLALFMSLLVMAPVWKEVYDESIGPYTAAGSQMSLEEAWSRGVKPVRDFMSRQIDMAGNSDDVWLFYQYLPPGTPSPETYDDVPLEALLPAFMLSELKVAFLIGFQIYLPFLILDIVVSSVTISMGMLMLPPVMISLPFKLLLFVLVDGWHLVVGMLLESFAPYT
jgi:flagellar biosynthetic protein FliP